MSRTSFAALLLALAAAVGLFLGSVGIYGVISYIVTQRTVEFGIRQAFGASAGVIRGMVLRQGVTLAVLGMVIGLAAAVACLLPARRASRIAPSEALKGE